MKHFISWKRFLSCALIQLNNSFQIKIILLIMTMTVRDLTIDDLPSITWSGTSTHLQYVAEAIERASRGEVDYLAISIDGQIRGIGGVDFTRNVGVGTLYQLTVHSDHQSHGIGTALIRALEKRILDRGLMVAELTVEQENDRARRLYEWLGYNIIGTTSESWKEEAENGEISMYTCQCFQMKKTLR